jgi:hypothetical protein
MIFTVSYSDQVAGAGKELHSNHLTKSDEDIKRKEHFLFFYKSIPHYAVWLLDGQEIVSFTGKSF